MPPFNPNGVASRLLQVSTYARPAAHDFCGCTQYRSTPDPGCVERFCWSGVLFHWNSSPDPKRVSVTFFWSPAYRSSPDPCGVRSGHGLLVRSFVQLGLISQSEEGFSHSLLLVVRMQITTYPSTTVAVRPLASLHQHGSSNGNGHALHCGLRGVGSERPGTSKIAMR